MLQVIPLDTFEVAWSDSKYTDAQSSSQYTQYLPIVIPGLLLNHENRYHCAKANLKATFKEETQDHDGILVLASHSSRKAIDAI